MQTNRLSSMYDIPGEHNTIRETTWDGQGEIEESTKNRYVYDADKYPVSSVSVVTSAGGLPDSKTFKY